MYVPKTLEDLKKLVENITDESLFLEFKGKDALDFKGDEEKKKKFSKTISSFANSAGGVVIYGIKEDKSDPMKVVLSLDPVTGQPTKEQLEQIIHSSISPKIDGLQIYPIESLDPNGIIFVIEIPQSTTVHQNTKDKIYYKRHNFSSIAMEDYEIKDVMNRARHPKVEIKFVIEKKTNLIYKNKSITEYYLHILLNNVGYVYANYIIYFIFLPKNILDEKFVSNARYINEIIIEISGDNSYLSYQDYNFKNQKYNKLIKEPRYAPLLPGHLTNAKTIKLNSNFQQNSKLLWMVSADNAPKIEGTILLQDIPIKDNWFEILNQD